MHDVAPSPMDSFTPEDKAILLAFARRAIEAAVMGQSPPELNKDDLPSTLLRSAACFVTITDSGMLRGCTGVLNARAPLIEEVIRTAAVTALRDPRFPPVSQSELSRLSIEISVLSTPEPLLYRDPEDLLRRLKPGVDGVILTHGARRATFLPQVWARVSTPVEFLDRLCQKMGLEEGAWRHLPMLIETYHVTEFSDAGLRS